MSNYRPICDTWILARSKTKYYGAYPAGFLSRARALLGVGPEECVLHVCAGKVREYPFAGVGVNDLTMDLDPALQPHIEGDARNLADYQQAVAHAGEAYPIVAVLADPPYTLTDAAKYAPGAGTFPEPAVIVKHALTILPVGGRVGILSLEWPRYPKATSRQVALVAVYVGNGNLGRTFAVFERTA